jgi:sulfite exporter TauE/SafE
MLSSTLTSTLGAALALGFAGGVHCAAMCGPLAIGGACREGRMRARPALEYLAGRYTIYILLGAVAGAFGRLLEQSSFSSIRLAVLVALSLWFIAKGIRLVVARRSKELVQLKRRRRSLFSFVRLPTQGVGLGLITGLLPCGLLYGALGLAASTASAPRGALVLFIFAVTTTPGLFAPIFLKGFVERRIPVLTSPKIQGLVWCALGVWLSFRPVLDAVYGPPGGCHG